ncbi:molybdopterin-dependent oxidoreductase [Paracoccus sp. JM45]|uniref:molybdopterin-dependent oxidoreductase n=1 Tax=Paracoccus sp. JM45 TaxID=2283626 RepID=UPI000E6CAFE7|nr:molybdopterin-dependent oxidoreductase [Paracoccus sp. JM45]RJE79892.1 oxidoreductase [Paracoccus sp. JM45]
MTHFKAAIAFASFLALPQGIYANPSETSDVLMTITTPTSSKRYDLDDLMAFPQVKFETSTIWTGGVPEFTGVSLSALLKDAGITEGTIMATAINDYAVEIPLNEINDKFPIIAYYQNDEPMSVRDKGPLWIVYPYDQFIEYQTQINYSRSIWQLDRIILE